MLVLGIAGTAKNTGKTTTTVAILNHYTQRLALTSIGYDGESQDNVTRLPKPRLKVPAGALIVTAESCLEAGSARIELLEKTDVTTPLGRLVLGRVWKEGLAVLAGPNNEGALRRFISRLEQIGADLLLVDGALGRLAPMAAADGLVLATGAARTRDLLRLAEETAAIAATLSLPAAENPLEPILKLGSLLVEKQGEEYASLASAQGSVEFNGVADVKALEVFLDKVDGQPDLIFRDPVKLLLSRDSVETAAVLEAYAQAGGARVMVRRPLPLKAITVNPFFPKFNEANCQYTPGYVDADDIYRTIAGAVSIPVVDVVRQGGAELARVLALD